MTNAQGSTINWPVAITRNRDALLRIVEALFAMAGLDGDAVPATLPRHLRNHLLRILRPAKSAVRRLVIIAARGLVVVVPAPRKQATTPSTTTTTGTSLPAVAALPLLDPRKRFDVRPRRRRAKSFPRICVIGLTEPTPIPDDWFPSPDDPVGAACLCRRLAALKRALDDLDGHAKRLARWKARRDLASRPVQGGFAPASEAKLQGANNRYGRFHPMRRGRPPGHRKRAFHEVDDVLTECHALALYARREEDTS